MLTVRDAQGKPVSGVPLALTQLSATNRQGASYPATLLLNGEDTFSGSTGDDGTVTLVLTDSEGLGLKSTLTFSLLNDAGEAYEPVTQSVIFTILTSPNSDKANFWGHMSDTLTAGNDTFKRPLLAAEWVGVNSLALNNEIWACANWPTANQQGSLATKEQLLALYQTYPNSIIASVYGWPLQQSGNGRFWSSSAGGSLNTHYVTSLSLGNYAVLDDSSPHWCGWLSK